MLTLRYGYQDSRRKTKHRICAAIFESLFEVGARRLKTIGKGMMSGTGIKENREGDRKSEIFVDKEDRVRAFLRKLPASESQYGCKKSRRVYVSAELNIRLLHMLCNANAPEDGKVRVLKNFDSIFVLIK